MVVGGFGPLLLIGEDIKVIKEGFMFGVYTLSEFKNLVRIENRKISYEVAIPIIKIKNDENKFIIDFKFNDEYEIHRGFFELPVSPDTEQINQAVLYLYRELCKEVIGVS